MKQLASILGTFILLANLACVAFCSAPVLQPPCHQQQPEAVKACDPQGWAETAVKVMLPAVDAAPLFTLPVAHTLTVRHALTLPPVALSPPLVLRI